MSLQAYTPYTYLPGFKYGEFHHAVLSISGTTHTLYLDGSAVNINNTNQNIFDTYSTINNTVIGAQAALTQAFKGIIGDVRIYNYAISASQVSSLYLNRNLVIHYPFDTSVNKITPNYGTMLYDASMIGALSFTTGLVGTNALSLTNSTGTTATQYIKSSPNNWLLGAGLTISCWINTAGASTGSPMRLFDMHGLAVDILETNKINSVYIPSGLPPSDYSMYYPLTSFNASNQLFNVASGLYEGTNTGATIDTVTKAFSTGSLKFTSNNQRYQISNITTDSSNATISVWFYATIFTIASNSTFIFSAGAGTGKEIQIGVPNGMLSLLYQDGSYVSTDQIEIDTISLNTWYHLAWVINGKNWSVYLNNKLYSKSSLKSLPIGSRTSYIGSNSVYTLNGNIQDFRVYNRNLTASEVSTLYNRVRYKYPPTDFSFNYPLTTISPTAGSQFLNTVTGTYVGTAYFVTSAPTISNSVYINPPGSLELKVLYAQCVQLSDYTNSSSNISISIWFRLKSYPNTTPFIYIISNATNQNIALYHDSNGKLFIFVASGAIDLNYAPAINKWTHFVWVINGTNWYIYIDGSLYISYTGKNSPVIATRYVKLGVNGGGNAFIDGYLQNFRIYDNKVLTADEASSLYYSSYYNTA